MQEFFKIVVVKTQDGLRTSAYIASQAGLVSNLEDIAREEGQQTPLSQAGVYEELPVERPYIMGKNGQRIYVNVKQVTLAEVEKRTGLIFSRDMHNGSFDPVAAGGAPPSRDGGDAADAEDAEDEPDEAVTTFPQKNLTSLKDVVL